jgi:hypothetical protein
VFPARDGSAVFGPTFQINWGQFSPTGPAVAQADVGLLIELPGPRRVVLVGRIVVALPPGPVNLVHLELDVLGVVDQPGALVSLDASLVRSHVLGVLRVTGDAAFRLSWGARPYLLLSLGGFNTGFTPEPGIGRPLARLAMALDYPTQGVTLRGEGYFAVTTSTLQFGGQLEIGVAAGPVAAVGFVTIDAIAFPRPFSFDAPFSVGFAVRFDGERFGSVTVTGRVSGPGPLRISASLEVEIMLVPVPWSETFEIGDPVDQAAAPVSLREVIAEQLGRPANLRSRVATDPAVRLAARAEQSDAPDVALTAPTGALRWTQSALPLETTILELGGATAADPGHLSFVVAGGIEDCGPAHEWFSPARFRKLTAAEALNQPSFAELDSGRDLALKLAFGPSAKESADFDAFVVRDGAAHQLGTHTSLLPGARLAACLAERSAAPTLTNASAAVAIDAPRERAWTVAGGGSSRPVSSETEAHIQVALTAGGAIAAAHAEDRVDMAGVL